ncbi:expressed unknown protein [Ectocarpus siliculosus]|uniref:Uncharacterized protein n=1 Tax=Ectocarpus siliculosus TaxID=2880 RepID=D7FTN2_ECTSI|nr:expressed unknown protein [Ectocarpus siliculosus]|eukprot:CBJ49255.1 expressed unknown protein [Ectocarpus siliculosus]
MRRCSSFWNVSGAWTGVQTTTPVSQVCRPRSPLVCRGETVHQALQDLLWSLLRVPYVLSHPCWETASEVLVPADEGQRRSDLADILERNTFIDCSALRTRAGVPQTTKSKSRSPGSSRNSKKRFVESVTSHFWTSTGEHRH